MCPTAVPPEHPDSYYSVADRLARETPGAFRPDQYSNPANPAAHERTTGPEIWRQTAGRVTHFVAGIGTGGTITGVAPLPQGAEPRRADRRRRPRRARCTRAAPAGRTSSRASARTSGPTTYDPSLVDRVVDGQRRASRSSPPAASRARRACSSAARAAPRCTPRSRSARELGPDDVVVVLLPDSGRGYLSKIFNDEWMADFGFLRAERPDRGRRARGARTARCPTSCSSRPTSRCATRSR